MFAIVTLIVIAHMHKLIGYGVFGATNIDCLDIELQFGLRWVRHRVRILHIGMIHFKGAMTAKSLVILQLDSVVCHFRDSICM